MKGASAHDFLVSKTEAIPLHRLALDAGLNDRRRPQAFIQLASSLRNVSPEPDVRP
ncbi:tetratricopeptide repeat protein [Pseudarthrobacter sp. So.54]